ncbi:MAG: lysylphosphatidylglycerol synthase domain-containing protein [Bacteroidota bacterium]
MLSKTKQIIKRGLTGQRLIRNNKLNWLLKLTVVVLLCWVLYAQIVAREDISAIWTTFKLNLAQSNPLLLAVAFLLMPMNWLLETLKWQKLVRHVEKVPFGRAIAGVMAGVSLSLFTPNRIGEYGGRILVVKPENNIKTVVVTLVGSFSQLVVLLSIGGMGLAFFVSRNLGPEQPVMLGIGVSVMLSVLLLLVCYFNIELVVPLIRKIPFIRKAEPYVTVLNVYRPGELLTVLTYSLSRYFIYSIQYYLLLQFLGVEVGLIDGLAGIALIFLLQTSLPLPPIWGILVRGEVALYVWSYFTANELSVLSATFGLWIINLIIPAMIGLIFILRVNVLSSLGYKTSDDKAEP